MKHRIYLLLAAFLITAAVQAQTTVDSIAAKYKLVPMPEPLTIEKTFPVLGTYQLGADAMATTSVSTSTTPTTTTPPAATETAPATNTTVGTETASAGSVVITLDPENKGVIWVEGLPQGKFKAYLKKSPSSYRILSQKTESGAQVPEGTLIYDTETKTLNIALGKPYDEADPAAIFALNTATGAEVAPAENEVKIKTKTATSKTKTKVTYYTATKMEATPTSTETTNPSSTEPTKPASTEPTPAPAPAQPQQPQQPQPGQAPQQ